MESNAFDQKIDKNSSELYFHYYAQLQHQQNMLQDYVRTGCYYQAIMENKNDFEGKAVMDVGAGSGILSLFAAQVHSFCRSRRLNLPMSLKQHTKLYST